MAKAARIHEAIDSTSCTKPRRKPPIAATPTTAKTIMSNTFIPAKIMRSPLSGQRGSSAGPVLDPASTVDSPAFHSAPARKTVVSGKRVQVNVHLGVVSSMKKKKTERVQRVIK